MSYYFSENRTTSPLGVDEGGGGGGGGWGCMRIFPICLMTIVWQSCSSLYRVRQQLD